MAKRKPANTVDELLGDQDVSQEEEDLLSPDAQGGSTVDDEFDEDSLSIDLDEIDESAATFQPVPAGTYECFIEEFELKRSQAGNPMVAARYKVLDGEYENRLFFDHFVLNNEIGKARLKKLLMELGFQNTGTFSVKDFVASGEAVGTRCRVKVAVTFNKQRNEKQNQVREVMPSASEDPFFD